MSQQSFSAYLMVTTHTLCTPHFLTRGLSLNTDNESGHLYSAYTKEGRTAQEQLSADCDNPSFSGDTEMDGRPKSRAWPHLDKSKCTLHLPSGMTDLPKDFAIDVDPEGQCSMTSEVNGETVVSNLGSIFYPTLQDEKDEQGGEEQEGTETGTRTEGGVV